MKILRVYSGEDGRSHFEDIEIALGEETPIGRLSELLPGEGVIFRETPAGYESGFHNAPRKQFVVVLSGGLELELADGTRRRVLAGECFLGDDMTGEGHKTRAIDGAPGRSLFIPLT